SSSAVASFRSTAAWTTLLALAFAVGGAVCPKVSAPVYSRAAHTSGAAASFMNVARVMTFLPQILGFAQKDDSRQLPNGTSDASATKHPRRSRAGGLPGFSRQPRSDRFGVCRQAPLLSTMPAYSGW